MLHDVLIGEEVTVGRDYDSRAAADGREAVVSLIRSGEIDVVKVIEIDEVAGTCRDVTDEIVFEALAARAA